MTTSTFRLIPLVLLAGWLTAAAVPAEEHVSFRPPPGFKRPTAAQARDYLQLQFVKDGEEASAWTELLRVEQFRRMKADRNPREAYDHLKATVDERALAYLTSAVSGVDKDKALYVGGTRGAFPSCPG